MAASRWSQIRFCDWSRRPNAATEILINIFEPASHRRGVDEKQISRPRPGLYPLASVQNARPEEKINSSPCGWEDFARGSGVCLALVQSRRCAEVCRWARVASIKAQAVHNCFGRFATKVCEWLGTTWSFAGAGLLIIFWGAAGLVLHFSTTWSQRFQPERD